LNLTQRGVALLLDKRKLLLVDWGKRNSNRDYTTGTASGDAYSQIGYGTGAGDLQRNLN